MTIPRQEVLKHFACKGPRLSLSLQLLAGAVTTFPVLCLLVLLTIVRPFTALQTWLQQCIMMNEVSA